MATELEAFLARHVEAGTVPGAVALRGGRDPEVVAIGLASIDGAPMREDAIMRIQSMTKAIIAVAALRLVEAGRIGLDQSVETWLPELADRRVLTSPDAALDDTIPARRSLLHVRSSPCAASPTICARARTRQSHHPTGCGAGGEVSARW